MLPGRDVMAVTRENARWFVYSGIFVAAAHGFLYSALAVAPIMLVAPLLQLSSVFRFLFALLFNPHHEVFGFVVILGTVVSILGACAFRPVHAKSPGSQEVRALLVARKQLQHKLTDIELSIRGILRSFGLKVGKVTDKTFEARIRKLVTGHAMLEQVAEAMLAARATLLVQFNKLHKAVLVIVRYDEVCRRFTTTPSVGAIVAITYKSALDDPGRIKKSKNAGPLFGLMPKRYQSGQTDVTGGIDARWRRDGARGPLRGGERVALAGYAFLGAQALGTGGGQAPRFEARKGGLRTKARVHPASYVGRR
jgi:hypothetical protein